MANLGDVQRWHCLFEQSGTFKAQFQKLGFLAYDYDVLDAYGQTDHKIDLFETIEKCFAGEPTFFDDLGFGDAIIAFFPCVRFEAQIIMQMRGVAFQLKDKTESEKLRVSLKLAEEQLMLYRYLCHLCMICLEKDIPLVVENPYSTQSFLNRYFPIQPAVVDMDRRRNGDYFSKPTQFFFFACKPFDNPLLDEPIDYYPTQKVVVARGAERSMLSPCYARRFIRSYLMGAWYDNG